MNTPPTSLAVFSCVFLGASLLAIYAGSQQDASTGRVAVRVAAPKASAPSTPDPGTAVRLLLSQSAASPRDQSFVPPAIEVPLARAFWSPTAGGMLGVRADSNSIRFEPQAPGSTPGGSWTIGQDALPNHVHVMELPSGDALAAARVAAGMSEDLAVAWLQWDGSSRGAPGLRLRAMALVDAIVLDPAAPRQEPIPATSIDGIEVLGWNAAEKEASLLLQIWGVSGAAEVKVRVLENGEELAGRLHSGPWWSLFHPETARGVWIGAGRDARAIAVGSERFVTLRTVPTPAELGRSGPLGRLTLYRASANGAWERLAISGEAPFVLDGYAAWANQSGALCVATPVRPDASRGVRPSFRTFRLKASPDGTRVWEPLRITAGAPEDFDWRERITIEDPTGSPRLSFANVDGTRMTVPASD